jgi:hypothetical protein
VRLWSPKRPSGDPLSSVRAAPWSVVYLSVLRAGILAQ